ncbi:hypothetical protein CNMCM8980_008650 [Aspergillus fumigatiaffinis]|uniref:Uncharacterized protein n=1 Tax=Aspergillus fumigatiaffinis TaxID=340414 RepID=A0A8H4H2N1_9EURO|nr:hypothetical protein CNMCM6457_008104 [Aspergillus fumigatiaffinis]KAF4234620.1 hypothetical protein CNMCM6805_008463 [Aspergillus fumigatiaffinis]KAF4246449.1 hypothetical protein CNMCM8980_008650 [Aspergillus fumigatiaffinis]
MSTQQTIANAARLLELCNLISRTARVIIDQWAAGTPAKSTNIALPALSNNTQKTLPSTSDLLTELVSDLSSCLLEVSSQYNKARALHIVAELCVPDVITRKESQQVTVDELSEATRIEKWKLGKRQVIPCCLDIYWLRLASIWTVG